MKCADFDNANIIYFHTKQGTLTRRSEVNCTEPFHQLVFLAPALDANMEIDVKFLPLTNTLAFHQKVKKKVLFQIILVTLFTSVF
jgi:hypothetical protein